MGIQAAYHRTNHLFTRDIWSVAPWEVFRWWLANQPLTMQPRLCRWQPEVEIRG
jgi:hypothetical protein